MINLFKWFKTTQKQYIAISVHVQYRYIKLFTYNFYLDVFCTIRNLDETSVFIVHGLQTKSYLITGVVMSHCVLQQFQYLICMWLNYEAFSFCLTNAQAKPWENFLLPQPLQYFDLWSHFSPLQQQECDNK